MSNLSIGQDVYGGKIFNIDNAGGHVLVCSVQHLDKAYTWNDANTFCNNLVENGYDDWRLPTPDELKLIYQNLQQSHKFDFGADFFWGQQFDQGNGWIIHFNDGGVGAYTKYGHYLGKVIPVRSVANAKYVVEMFGRRGEMEFAGPIESKPTTANIKLYGLTTSDSKTYILNNGSWTDQDFIADITGGVIPGISANPALKIKFTSGTYQFIGIAAPKSYINSGNWNKTSVSLVLGHNWTEGQTLLPQNNLPDPVYSTVVFDHCSFPSSSNTYDYGWWSNSSQTPTCTTLKLLFDGLQKELALYKFDNNASLSNDPKILNKYKIRAYKYDEINNILKDYFPSYYYLKYPFPELTALLLSDAMQIAPSTILGLASSGHGSPEGIMNTILDDEQSIGRCFSWIMDLRQNKPIDFFDFATNCNVASLLNMQAMVPYSQYVLASDLTRNSPGPSINRRPCDHYQSYFDGASENVEVILRKMLDDYDTVYNDDAAKQFYASPDALKSGNTLSGWKEQITLFACRQFPPILEQLGGNLASDKLMERLKQHPELFYTEVAWQQADFKTAVEVCFPEFKEFDGLWDAFAIKQINNRRSLAWDINAPHGLLVK